MKRKVVKRARYPRFVRDDVDLYRIGWSKDRDSEYLIGKLPRFVVEMVVTRILDTRDIGGNFRRSDFKDLTDPEHGEILFAEIGRALLWLQSAQIIEKFNRGYQVRPTVNLLDEWETRWERVAAGKGWQAKTQGKRRR